jgi:hypothetical protein
MGELAVDIADAVVTALNDADNEPAGGWAETFTATRQYIPVHQLEDIKTATVTVAIVSDERTKIDRTNHQRDVQISVGIQKQYEDESEIDDLMLLAEQIAGVFGGSGVRAVAGAAWIETKTVPVLDVELARTAKAFTRLVVYTFRYFGTSNVTAS